MQERTDLRDIAPGMPVYGFDGELLGPVESIPDGDHFRALDHLIPAAAIARVDGDGVHLRVAKAAFTAAPPATRDQPATAER